ncbi:LuxR C-terminal-related transcriptional regulator [Mixta tenebrionis]|jgi:two-component system capsular synthesis response regulator RcsB|uniref:Transcriptional regulatory protein RcsB n=2 Tax=Mixta TaxID=2100764 RepID=A0A6P1Q5D5_9GAMM|nr:MULTISPECIES: response regulator transcription factor [Mixta]QHM73148.1 Transcriptional regulatory protein RcsB [Mixta intestinalis]QHM77559.1 Transcriptional regulatory protein RcsB [Mixta theicola]TPW40719.1 response regulator transcription factor [Mixta tenebrionis]
MLKINLAISDKYPAIQYFLCNYVKDELGCNIISDFSLSEAGIVRSSCKEKIDAIITDLSYGNDETQIYGVSKIRAIQRAAPEAKVILYVEYDNLSILKKAISYGADAIVSKYDPVSEMKKALCEIFSKKRNSAYLSKFISSILENDVEKTSRLTAKEWEIIRLYSMGLSLSNIAKKQNRAVSTVATQKYNAMKKLNVNTNSELIQYACMNNII